MSQTPPARPEALNLEFPRSLAVFEKYADAQKVVDFLSDEHFAVQNVMIVGTDLKQVERVTGRLTWPRVLGGGALSGIWMGLFVGLILSLFEGQPAVGLLIAAMGAGALFGLVWAGLGYSLSRGRRDFTSVSQVVATKYEVLVEHREFDAAHQIISRMDGVQGSVAAQPAPPSRPDRPNPYEGLYGQKVDSDGRPVPTGEDDSPGSSTSAGTDAPGSGGVTGGPYGGSDEPQPPQPPRS